MDEAQRKQNKPLPNNGVPGVCHTGMDSANTGWPSFK